MASIERTAYPRFSTGRILKEQDLNQLYSLTPDELRYIKAQRHGSCLPVLRPLIGSDPE
jgi:hypothetical protein